MGIIKICRLSMRTKLHILVLPGAIGFLLSLCILLYKHDDSGEPFSARLQLFSRLNIFCVLFSTVGGFAVIFSLAFHFLRSFNRVSIFILFISICTLCITLQNMWQYVRQGSGLKKVAFQCFCFALFTVCLFDQLPTYRANDSRMAANQEAMLSDKAFVKELESGLQSGDMVFQLPYHAWPESGPVNGMTDYYLFTGYLHSDNLRWSYGGIKGRESDKWNKYVSGLPVGEMVDTIIKAGFRVIYIDKRAYTDEELHMLQSQIETVTGATQLISPNGTLCFYNLYPYIEEHSELLSEQPPSVEDLLHSLSYDY